MTTRQPNELGDLADQVEVTSVVVEPDPVDLFMFSAAAWLLHRVHYDAPHTTQTEGLSGLMIHGPLQGMYMMGTLRRWLGPKARVRSIKYRHRAPAFVGERLECGGRLLSKDEEAGTATFELWARRSDETVTTVGEAVVGFS
jgi:hydroxyacyl-ACP dehydratase HTD2-like protein with hotdog domain